MSLGSLSSYFSREQMMKQPNDLKTLEFPTLENPISVPVKRGRGRPVSGLASSVKERQRVFRAKKLALGIGSLTIELPLTLIAELDKWILFKDETKSEIVARLLVNQLLRKR